MLAKPKLPSGIPNSLLAVRKPLNRAGNLFDNTLFLDVAVLLQPSLGCSPGGAHPGDCSVSVWFPVFFAPKTVIGLGPAGPLGSKKKNNRQDAKEQKKELPWNPPLAP